MTKFAASHWPKDWWYWNHHTARFGIIVPGLLFQSIFGGHAIVSYLPSFTMFLICVAVIFKLSFEKVSSIIFLIFFLTYVLARDMVLHFSQFEVSIFTQAYMLLCFYFISKIIEKDDNSRFKIVAASLYFFCAYLAKEDNLFYLPGSVSIFFLNNKYKWGLYFLAINLALFLTETSLYALLTQFSWGRASVIIHANHLLRIGPDWEVGDSIWFLFTRFCFVSGNLKILLYFYLISFPLVLFVFKKVMSKDLLQVAPLPLSFYFCITFAVNGINPYRPIMPFEGRFLMSTFPFLTLYCMFLFHNIASNYFENERYQFF